MGRPLRDRGKVLFGKGGGCHGPGRGEDPKKVLDIYWELAYEWIMLKWILPSVILCLAMDVCPIHAAEKDLRSQVWAYNGKSYKSIQTQNTLPTTRSCGITWSSASDGDLPFSLDSRKYSGFDLLEIEALFKFKKSSESYDLFLKGFPKIP